MRRVANRYELEQRAGRGGGGHVWAARDLRTGTRVAIKELGPPGTAHESQRERMLREFRIVRRFAHANIVRMLDAVEDGDDLFLVMELLDGKSLDIVLQHGALPYAEACAVGAQLCAALAYAHAADVVHRDIKPSNVMICPDGRAVVMDFGIAKEIQADRHLTASGVMVGTPLYMAPETINGERPTSATDLYSLGCLLYEMISGALPFSTGNREFAALLVAKITSDAPSLGSACDAGVPPELVALVDQLLSRSPRHRSVSAQRVGAVLGEWRAPNSRLAALLADVPDEGPPPLTPEEDPALRPADALRLAPAPPPGLPPDASETGSFARPWFAEPEVRDWVTGDPSRVPHTIGLRPGRVVDSTTTTRVTTRVSPRRNPLPRIESRFREAVTMARTGDHVAALPLHEEIAALRAQALGADHLLTLTSHFWVAWCLTALGRSAEAEQLLLSVSELARRRRAAHDRRPPADKTRTVLRP